MPEPIRTPKQSRVAAKSKGHPYARSLNGHHTRDVGVERSNSLLGALKNIVSAPLAWFSSGDSQGSGDTHLKRRVSTTERDGTPPKAKRVRRNSPEVEVVGYLDPPPSVFMPKRSSIPLWNAANGVSPARAMSLDLPPSAIEPIDLPLPLSRGTSLLTHVSMSVDPQDTLPIRQSLSQDISMPPPSPFARSLSRSGFTLVPGATFGPSPKRRARESTAPPLLGSSTSTPSFTRPPTSAGSRDLFPPALSRGRSEGPMSTLLAQSRQSVSPIRDSPSRSMGMLVGDDFPVPRSLKTERTLSTLESFRTPLHASPFPSTPPVEKNLPRKVHVPVPSKLWFDHTPPAKKDKVKRAEVIGPYSSGMSGMRKLLARRREELEKETETDTEARAHTQGEHGVLNAEPDGNETQEDQAIDTDVVSESRQSRLHVNGVSSNRDDLSPSSSPGRSKADSYSSLRASSNKVHRSHASAPKLKKPRNKFSLDDEEEEQEWSMSIEELKNYQARVQTHISFSNNRRMSETGMQTDTSAEPVSSNRVVSPDLPAQPQTFDSLLSRIGTSTSTAFKPVAEFPVEPPKGESDAPAQTHLTSPSGSTAPATLPFSFGVSSATVSMPKPADILSSPFAAPSTSSVLPSAALPAPALADGAVPSFFANTNKQFTPPKVPSGSLFGSQQPSGDREKATEQPPNMFEAAAPLNREETKEEEMPKEPYQLPSGGVNKPSVLGGATATPFSNAPFPSKMPPDSTTDSSSPFGKPASEQVNGSAKESTSAFSFGPPGGLGTDAPTPGISIFGAAGKSGINPFTSDKPAFSFNTNPSISTSAPSAEKPKETASTAPSSEAGSKPVFSFGTLPPSSTEVPKNPFAFGASTQPKASETEAAKSPFSFGAAPSTPPAAEKKSGFTFGVTGGATAFSSGSTAMTPGASNTLTPQATKPVFGGFGSVGTPVTPGTPKPAESTADSDGMEVAADGMEESPTRTVDKKDMPAIQPPQSSPFAAFGSGSSTGFSFGQVKSIPTGSTFSLAQSKPTPINGFSFGQNLSTSTTSENPSTGFSFGASSTKTTGQSSAFGAPLASAFGSAAPNTSSASSFSFAQPSSGTSANPFGESQKQQENGATTAPSSPSLFPQSITQPQSQSASPSFSFSLPAATGSFGAAKPDASASPSPSIQPFKFGASSLPQQPPQPPQQAGSPAPNAMFTLGGAAATPPRRMKGLPTRRGKRP